MKAACGAVVVVSAWWFYTYADRLERRLIPRITVPRIVAVLYDDFGKWGTTGLIGALGVCGLLLGTRQWIREVFYGQLPPETL